MTDFKPSNNPSADSPSNALERSTEPTEATENTMKNDMAFEDENDFSYQDYKIEDWLTFALFWLLALTVFSQFVSRYVFSAPLGWTEEVARYQLVCLGFLGGTMGVRKNTHIFVTIFHRWMPASLSTCIYKLISICNCLFLMGLAYFAWQIIPLIHIHKMASLPLSISVLYGIVFGGLLIMILRSIQYMFQSFSQSKNTNNKEIN